MSLLVLFVFIVCV